MQLGCWLQLLPFSLCFPRYRKKKRNLKIIVSSIAIFIDPTHTNQWSTGECIILKYVDILKNKIQITANFNIAPFLIKDFQL